MLIPSHQRAGYTLIELTVSLAVTSLILVGIGSAIVLTGRAIPDGQGSAADAIEAGDVMARLSNELQHAQFFAERSEHTVTFTVPDRDADDSPERISYAWSGVSGDPLTRTYNNQPSHVIVPDVNEFALSWHSRSQQIAYPGPAEVSSEHVLSSADSLLGLGSNNFEVGQEQWAAQYIAPSLPADAVWWRPTRLVFRGGLIDLSDAILAVQLRRAHTGRTPHREVLDQVLIDSSVLGSLLTWDEAQFTAAPRLQPGQPIAIVMRNGDSSENVAKVKYYDGTSLGGLAEGEPEGDGDGDGDSDGDGERWDRREQQTLRHYLYGRVATPGEAQTFDHTSLQAVDVRLRTAEPAAATMQTQVALLNRPEVLSGYWKLDFEHDPTALDFDGNGQDDWQTYTDDPFDPASLDASIWEVDRTLIAQSTGPLTQPMCLRLRWRHTGDNDSSAFVRLEVDRADGTIGSVIPAIQHNGDNTQTLTLYTQHATDGLQPLTTLTGLPSDMIDTRLLIDPAHNTVNIRVNGTDRGTYHYTRRSASDGNGSVAAGAIGEGAQFDYLEFTVTEP